MVGSGSVAITMELLIIEENGNNSGDSNWNADTGDKTQLQLSDAAPVILEDDQNSAPVQPEDNSERNNAPLEDESDSDCTEYTKGELKMSRRRTLLLDDYEWSKRFKRDEKNEDYKA